MHVCMRTCFSPPTGSEEVGILPAGPATVTRARPALDLPLSEKSPFFLAVSVSIGLSSGAKYPLHPGQCPRAEQSYVGMHSQTGWGQQPAFHSPSPLP